MWFMSVLGKAQTAAAGADFLEWLGPDTSAVIFALLRDPADIARASAVSRSWRTIVLATHFSKIRCLRLCREAANFARVEMVTASCGSNNGTNEEAAGSSAAATWEKHKREQRAYTHLADTLFFRRTGKHCIAGCVGASSTDDPDESIQNTLDARDSVDMNPCCWSSKGQLDPDIPECLIYKLCSDLCVIDEIRIRPFRAYFEDNEPIYSARYVRFSLGYPKLPLGPEDLMLDDNDGNLVSDNNYIWTYTSPMFSMMQKNILQAFRLPSVLCIGGVVKVELLGRVQKQEDDDLYYIRMSHIHIVGSSLSSQFGVAACENDLVLKYCPDPESPDSLSKWRDIEARFWRQVSGRRIQLNQELASRLLGPP